MPLTGKSLSESFMWHLMSESNALQHIGRKQCVTIWGCTKHQNLFMCPIAHVRGMRKDCEEWKPGEKPKPGKTIKWKGKVWLIE